MKVDVAVKSDTKTTEDVEKMSFGLDASAEAMMYKTMAESLYSNKIGSIVREITSNCFDSHVEADVKYPVDIILESKSELLNGRFPKIIFQDHGMGISPDRMQNVYSKFYGSTKRDTNGQIGGWGLGAKSPLSYTDEFSLVTRHNGVQYEYLIHKGKVVPEISLIHKESTELPNGSQVLIGIKNTEDYEEFEKEIQSQLHYFDNIQYTNCGHNNFKVYKNDLFLYRQNLGEDEEAFNTTELEIAIGTVRYPLSFSQVNDPLVYKLKGFPVALRFEIGEIGVTPSRETIEYTKFTKEAIIDKAKAVFKFIEQKVAERKEPIEDFMDYYRKSLDKEVKISLTNDIELTVPSDLGFKNQYRWMYADKFENKVAEYDFNLQDILLIRDGIFESGTGNRQRLSSLVKGDTRPAPLTHNDLTKSTSISNRTVKYLLIDKLISSGRLSAFHLVRQRSESKSRMKEDYLLETYGDCLFVRKREDSSCVTIKWKKDVSTPQSVRDRIHDFLNRQVMKSLISNSTSFEETKVPDAWAKNWRQEQGVYKNDSDRTKKDGEVILRHIKENDKEIEFISFKQSKVSLQWIDNSFSKKEFLIYGTHKQVRALSVLHSILEVYNTSYPNTKRAKYTIAKVAQADVKKLKDLNSNVLSIDQFIDKHYKVLSRMAYVFKFMKYTELLKTLNENDIHTVFIGHYLPGGKYIHTSTMARKFRDVENAFRYVPDAHLNALCNWVEHKQIFLPPTEDQSSILFYSEFIDALENLEKQAPLLKHLSVTKTVYREDAKKAIQQYLIEKGVIPKIK